jgi:DNA repair protein RadC
MKAIYETRLARVGETTEHYTARITSSDQACEWAVHCLDGYFADRCDQEELLVAVLNTKLDVKKIVRVTRGTLNSSLAHPREVFRPAIAYAANSIILIHNHPSGDTWPSEGDFSTTLRIRQAGELIGIPLTDHIIVGDGKAQSIKALRPW